MTKRSFPQSGILSRAEQRQKRLLEAEAELAIEEADALKMTEEQQQMLAKSFLLVKTEFSDLDGLRWTQSALREFQSRHAAARSHPTPRPSESNHKYVSLTGSDSLSVFSDDTIRIASFSVKTSVQPHVVPIAQLPCRNRDGSRSRSSIAGIFASYSTT